MSRQMLLIVRANLWLMQQSFDVQDSKFRTLALEIMIVI